jgi:WXG100 family type VII secretion target
MKYQFDAIHDTANNIAAQAQALHHQNDALRGYVNNLVSNWQGNAQSEYHQKQQVWDASFKDMLDTLQLIVTRVHDAADAMHHTETKNASVWG